LGHVFVYGETKSANKFLFGKPPFRGLGVDGKIILECIFRK